jgi:Aldehyde dehydrogenase family
MQDALQTHPRALYARLGKQFIAGHWRDGRAGASTADIDPYNGIDILSIALANRADLDEAFAAAANAQRKWDAVLPAEKQRSSAVRRQSWRIGMRRSSPGWSGNLGAPE